MDTKYIRSPESVRIGQDATDLLRQHKEGEAKRNEHLSGVTAMTKTLQKILTARESDAHVCTHLWNKLKEDPFKLSVLLFC